MGNLNESADQWLKRLFEDEFCSECGGDAEHHTAVPFMGNWFARCDYPPAENDDWHPVVRKYRARYDKAHPAR
jgi:hypothetical protein